MTSITWDHKTVGQRNAKVTIIGRKVETVEIDVDGDGELEQVEGLCEVELETGVANTGSHDLEPAGCSGFIVSGPRGRAHADAE